MSFMDKVHNTIRTLLSACCYKLAAQCTGDFHTHLVIWSPDRVIIQILEMNLEIMIWEKNSRAKKKLEM